MSVVAKKIIIVTAIVMLTAGIALLLFPTASNFIGKQIANSESEQFDEKCETAIDNGGKTFEEALENGEVDKEGYPIDKNGRRISNTPVIYKPDIDRLLKDSESYNENLKHNQSSLLISEEAYASPSLDMTEYGIFDGIYGYVSAPSIGLKLPIYLGANDTNMSYGAAHLTYTSLPLGGESTNTVLAGHTGYIGRIFFDNLRQLQIGDTVSVKNFWTTLNYKVIKTEIHKPNDSKNVFISPGKDLLTLITCISDDKGGFNRYYVICERI